MIRKFLSWHFSIPLLVFLVLGLTLLILLTGFSQKPQISSIEPRLGKPGDVLIIQGLGFGADAVGSWVTLGGRRIASSNLLDWNDTQVSVRIPYNAFSGLVQIHTSGGIAQGPLFVNQDQLPTLVGNDLGETRMLITGFSTTNYQVGQVVSILGRGFGSGILQRQIVIGNKVLPSEDILLWSDREIQIVVPPVIGQSTLGIVGNPGASRVVQFPSPTGISQPLKTGSKSRWNVEFRYNAGEVEETSTGTWGTIAIYVPRLPSSLGQNSIFDTYRGGFTRDPSFVVPFDTFLLDNPEPDTEYNLDISWIVELEALERDISNLILPRQEIPASYRTWLDATAQVPIGDQALKTQAELIVKGITDPLAKAQAILEFVADSLSQDPQRGLSYGLAALEDGSAQSFGYANLAVALLRLSGIPARLVEGAWLGQAPHGPLNPHYWGEFFVVGLGWIEIDPWLYDSPGLTRQSLGNFDGLHLALVKEGQDPVASAMDPRGVKLFGTLVLMDSHGLGRGNVESFGLQLSLPDVRNLSRTESVN